MTNDDYRFSSGKPISKLSQSFNKKETIREYNPKEPYYTIVCRYSMYYIYLHNGNTINLTKDVAQKLQGFPDNYFNKCKSQDCVYKMIGNAVPCQVGYIVCMILQQV